MSIRIGRAGAFDEGVWDSFVSEHPHGHFMQSWAWGQFRLLQGWEPLRFLATRDGQTCGAMQVLVRRFSGGFAMLHAPRGPVADLTDVEVLSALFDAARHIPGIVSSLRLDPYCREDSPHSFIESGAILLRETWSYWNAPKYVFWLDLTPGIDTLFKRLGSSDRSEIRFPLKRGVGFVRGSESDTKLFYNLMIETARHKGIACHGEDYYRSLLDILGSRNMVDFVFAEFEGRMIATGMTILYGRKAWLLYAASDSAHYRLRPNRALQWEMIRAASEVGCERYDLRGTATGNPPNPNDPGYGVYKFKNSFGPEFVSLAGYYDVVTHPLRHKVSRFIERRGLPIAYAAYNALQNGFAKK